MVFTIAVCAVFCASWPLPVKNFQCRSFAKIDWIVLFYCRQLLKWFSNSNCYCSASHPMKQKTSICGTAQPATGRKKLGIGWIVVLSNDRRRDAGQIWTKPIGLVTNGPITLVCPRTGRMTVWWSEWQRPQRECPQHFSAFARNIGHRRR